MLVGSRCRGLYSDRWLKGVLVGLLLYSLDAFVARGRGAMPRFWVV